MELIEFLSIKIELLYCDIVLGISQPVFKLYVAPIYLSEHCATMKSLTNFDGTLYIPLYASLHGSFSSMITSSLFCQVESRFNATRG